jgi:hypothetical protein
MPNVSHSRVLLGAVTFGITAALTGLTVTAIGVFGTHYGASRPDPRGDFLLAAYLSVMSNTLSTLGFLTMSAPWRQWREQETRRVVWVSALLGLINAFVPISGLAFLVPGFGTILRQVPLLAPLVAFTLPGVVLGLLGPLLTCALPRRRTTA